MRIIGFLLAIALAVYALTDLAGSDARRRGGIPKAVWTVLILVIPILGPIAWLLVSRVATAPPSTGPSAPLAPDDDPDFLWKLDQDKRRGQSPAPGEPDESHPR